MEVILSFSDTSTLLKKWLSLKRGDIIKLKGEEKEKIVSHVVETDNGDLVVTFSNEYIVINKNNYEHIKDFEITAFYFLERDKKL